MRTHPQRIVQTAVVSVFLAAPSLAGPSDVVHVADVEALYAAINDPGHAGAAIVLAAGHYTLTALDPQGVARPNGGRLELQSGMSLSGVSGRPDDVVIDGSDSHGPSFAPGNSGPVRIGRSHESIEWLTVLGAPRAGGSIVTDLVGDSTATLRIAHVIATGSVRGIDVRNTASAGRTIIIDLDDNELTGNTATLNQSGGQGLRFVNLQGADLGTISASLHGNWSHDNLRGCIIANLASNRASITIDSHDDRFDNNNVGCVIYGATTQGNGNTVSFTAHAGSVSNNVGVLQPENEMGGLVVVGGHGQLPGSTSDNVVQMRFWGTKFGGNGVDISAWGAFTTAPSPAGTNNTVLIDLNGVSKQAVTDATPSTPPEAAGSDTATIIQ